MKVVAASIENKNSQILISKRPAHTYGGGLWELPGGKLEPGEGAETALFRELEEELGIQINSAKPLIAIDHQYPDRSIHLMVYQVTDFEGAPYGKEGQEIRWVTKEALPSYTFPGANKPAIDAVRLPDLVAVVALNHQQTQALKQIEQLLESGVGCLVIEDSSDKVWLSIETQATMLFEKYSAFCLTRFESDLVEQRKTHGLHLTKEALLKTNQRPLPKKFWLSAHCESQEDLAHAESIGIDFVLFGTLDAEALGQSFDWEAFKKATNETKLPVYALAGINTEVVEKARVYGGRGAAALLVALED